LADPAWFRRVPDGWEILIHAQPGASRTLVDGIHGDCLKLRVQAPPVDGRANTAIIAFVAETLGITRRGVEIIAGASSRRKRLLVRAPDADPSRLLG